MLATRTFPLSIKIILIVIFFTIHPIVCDLYKSNIDPKNHQDIDALIWNDPSLTNVSLPERVLSNHSDLSAFYIEQTNVYVFGKNVLHHLNIFPEQDDVFELNNRVNIEPKNADQCLPLAGENACECSRDNIVTSVFLNNGILVGCGTRAQGRCFVFQSTNISNHLPYFKTSVYDPSEVVASYKSSVVFPGKFRNTTVFYMGFEDDCERPFNASSESSPSVPFISARTIGITKVDYVLNNSNFKSRLKLKASSRKKNDRIQFIYGFDGNDYAYFVTIHRSSATNVETRIGRTCHKDELFSAYTEVPLKCGNFHIARSAADFKHHSLGRTLLVSFNSVGNNSSAVCLFRLSDIDELFVNATRNCLESGSQSQLLPAFYQSDTSCSLFPYDSIEGHLCIRSQNQFILGQMPLDEKPLIRLANELIVSVGAEKDPLSSKNNRFILLLTTNKSRLIRYDVDEESAELKVKNNFVKPFSQKIKFDSRLPLLYNRPTESFYLLTKSSIVQVPVGTCSIYTSCANCNLRDKHCLWWNSKCYNVDDIPSNERDVICPPEVYSYNPNTGPLQGGTVLTFYGLNFGESINEDQNNLKITLGKRKCSIIQRNNRLVKCKIDENTPVNLESTQVRIIVAAKYGKDLTHGYYIDGRTQANVPFRFENPEVRGIFPSFGPFYGGTSVMIYGKNLNVGGNLTVFFGDFPCRIIFRQEMYAVCKTSFASNQNSEPKQITVSIDSSKNILNKNNTFKIRHKVPQNQSRKQTCRMAKHFNEIYFCKKVNQFFEGATELPLGESYQYLPNPIVIKADNLNTIMSGNTTMRFRGNYLGSSAFPIMTIYHLENPSIYMLCNALSNQTILECPLQSSKTDPTLNQLLGKKLEYKLRFDGYLSPPNELKVYPDPVFNDFKSTNIASTKEKLIEFTGENLDPNIPYNVELKMPSQNSTIHCDIEPRSNNGLNRLWCRANATDEVMDHFTGSNLDVNITVGRSLKFSPGSVRFESDGIAWFPIFAVVIVCAMVGVFIYTQLDRCRPNNQFKSEIELDPMKWKVDLEEIFLNNSTEDKRFEKLFEILNEKNMLINPIKWVVKHHLGQGHYGLVFKAAYETPDIDPETREPIKTDVALKIQNQTGQGFQEFISEAEIMVKFNHPNVMHLIGVTLHSTAIARSPAIVLPFMNGRDLKDFVSTNDLTVRDLLGFGLQIANGMTYLSELGTIHRDLALRNCLVQRGNPPLVKVADFGLTRNTDYYVQISKHCMPFKWMAPEALKGERYDHKIDVYSYGVTLWELMTRGRVPFELLSNEELLRHLEGGKRLEMPQCCPDLIYAVMGKCWMHDPKDRPTFREVHDELKQAIELLQNLEDNEPHLYQNSYFYRFNSDPTNIFDYRESNTREIINRAQEDILRDKIGITFDPSQEFANDNEHDNISEPQEDDYQPPDYSEATRYPAASYQFANGYPKSGPSNRASAPPLSFKNVGY